MALGGCLYFENVLDEEFFLYLITSFQFYWIRRCVMEKTIIILCLASILHK